MKAIFTPSSEELPTTKGTIYPFDSLRSAVADAPIPELVSPPLASRPRGEPVLPPREQAYQLSALLLTGDWAVASIAIFAGVQIREWQRMGTAFDSSHHLQFLTNLLPWSVVGGGIFTWFMVMNKTYDVANIYRMQLWLKSMLRSAVLWSVAIWAYIGLFDVHSFTPRVGVVYCVIAIVAFIVLWRLVSFVFLIQPSVKEKASSRVIVVGWNEQVAHLHRSMRQDFAQLRDIIGCVPMPTGEFGSHPPRDLAVLGDYQLLPQLVVHCGANSILLADGSCGSGEIQLLAKFCQREMLEFQMVPEYFPALNSALQVQTVSGVPLLGVSQLPLERTVNRIMKRGIDVFGGLIGLMLSAPIIAIFSAIVFIESPGPIFYWQRRTTRGGRHFMICKIRSMRMDAESGTGAVWCKKQDDRRLKVGKFMRTYNVDELPQFWNVITGDLSLVGPRPERPELIEKFKDQIPNYNARQEVRAGLTGWAQIQGLRGDTDLGKRIEADIYYLENWSVMLDLYCIAATFFKNKNAH